MAAGRLSPDARALLVIAGVVLLANALYLLGIFDADPLGPRSGLVAALTPGPLRGQPTIDPNVGFISQAVGHRAVLDLLHLQLPWWNPYEGTGAPLAGGMQAAALFPLTLLTWMQNGQIYEHVLLELLAGVSSYRLLRRLAIGRLAATAGATAFALNGTFAWFAHATVNPVPFLPLLLLGVERARAAALDGRPGGWRLLAVAGALSFYGGFPEVAYLDALLAVVWFAWRCAGLGRREVAVLARKVGTGAIAGVLLSAPLLIAMLDYFGHADLWRHSGGYFSHVHLPARTMPQMLLPYVFGPILGYTDPRLTVYADWVNVGGFLTSSLLVLALLGLLSKGRRGLRGLLAGWTVLMVARAYALPVLGGVVNVLPGLANAAVFRYCWPSLELAMIVLAAIGLDGLIRSEHPRGRVLAAGGVGLLAVAGAALAAHPLTSQLGSTFSRRPYFAASVAWGAIVVVGLVGSSLLGPPRVRMCGAAVVLIADAVLLFVIPELSAPRGVQVDTAPVAYLRQHLATGRYFTLGPLAPNYGSYYGLASLNAVDVPVPSAFAAYVSHRLDQSVDPTAFVGNLGGGRPLSAPSPEKELLLNLAGYREAGVSYVLTPAGQTLPQSPRTFVLADRTPTTWIYRLRGARPYMTAPGCSITIESRTSAHLACRRPAVLERLETEMPGWKASVDGRATPIRLASGIFQSVTVPAGTHTITFSYAPPRADWGFLALLAGVAVCLVPFIRDRLLSPSRCGQPGPRRASGSDVKAALAARPSASRSLSHTVT